MRVAEGLLQFDLPQGFQWRSEEGGGAVLSSDPPGVIHVSVEEVVEREALPNLSRMLANFVTLHVKPVATDELDRLRIDGGLGFSWEYREQLEGGRTHCWRVWVVGNSSAYAFVSFNCDAQHRTHFREPVDQFIASIRLGPC